MNTLMSVILFAITAFFGSVSSFFDNCIGERCFTISGSNETKNFDNAKNWCQERSSSLAVVNDSATQDALMMFLQSAQMKVQPISSMFIDLQLSKKLRTWYLVDGTPYLGGILEQNENQYFFYIYLQSRSNNYFVYASKPYSLMNFICEYEATRCLNISTNNRSYNVKCFVKYENENLTWFKARERCHNDGGDLATFNHPLGTTGYPNYVTFDTSWLSQSLSYWVGIRWQDWSWTSYDSNKEAIYTWWSTEKPNNTNYECVCVDPEGSPVWSWKDCDCNAPRQFVCLKIVPTTTAPTTTTTTAISMSSTISFQIANVTNNSTSINALAIGLGVGLGGGVFIILLVVIIVVAVTLTRKRRRENNGTEDRHELESTRKVKKNKTPNTEFAASDRTEIYAQVVPATQHSANNSNSQNNIIYSTPTFTRNHLSDPSDSDPTDIRRGNTRSIFLEGPSDAYSNPISTS